MSEDEQQAGSAETLAEIMARHGMARYADPDVLEAYVRPAPGPGTEGGNTPPVRE